VGENGVVLAIDGALASPATPAAPTVERVDIGTKCALTSVFARGQDIWITGSSGARSGVWRLRDRKVADRWGAC
jgi:hypothetical protein